jgi:midasin
MLAHKGYNMPPEANDEKEGEGDADAASGMGLGEGEGEKDVSDRLESEDQLEGATQEGQEKEDRADKDLQVIMI